MITTVTGVVLAGGKSTRMGRNKALLPCGGKTLVEMVCEKLNLVFPRILLSVHQEEAYAGLHFSMVTDRYAEIGPIGGITSVLESGEDKIFCAACDMPFLNPDLIEFICQFSGFDAVLPVWRGKTEVLHALYSRDLLPAFQESISRGRYRITDALADARVKHVDAEQIWPIDPNGLSFRNLNTPG